MIRGRLLVVSELSASLAVDLSPANA